jgi:nucleotide-binding universal stress UspA family protein
MAPRVSVGYRRIVVPIADNAESEKAMDVACRLAAEHRASIAAVTVTEVPPLLPLDAHMREEEEEARELLLRAHAIGVSYGVDISVRVLRSREAASAIVGQAKAIRAEIIVIGGARKSRARPQPFGHTIQEVLKKALCRVMVVAAPAERQAADASGSTSRYPTPASVRR